MIFVFNSLFSEQKASFPLAVHFLSNAEHQLTLFGIGLATMSVIHASHVWTVVLGGNIDLSIMISLISNILSFGKYSLDLHQLYFELQN